MKRYYKKLSLLMLTAVLPAIYGCGGGGIAGLTSLLFGSGALAAGASAGAGAGAGALAGLGAGAGAGAGAGIGAGAAGAASTIVNPEPTSMLLLGSGMMAMAYYKKTLDKKTKK